MNAFIEGRAPARAPLPPVDPRITILCAAAVAVSALFSDLPRLLGLAALCLGLGTVRRIRPTAVLKRLIPSLPLLAVLGAAVFVFPGAPGGAAAGTRAALLAGRAAVVCWSIALLPAAMSSADIVRGLSGLGVPSLLTSILFFAARYESLFRREAARTRDALLLRTAGNRRVLRRKQVLSRLAFRPVERAFDRSEWIHAAMLARGWNGSFPARRPLRLSRTDFAVLAAVGAWITIVLEALP